MSTYMMSWLIGEIVEEEVRSTPFLEIETIDDDGNQQYNKRDNAVLITYQTKDFKFVQILIWGPYNYMGVFASVSNERPQKRPDFTKLKIIGYHDSCWKNSLRDIIEMFEPHMPDVVYFYTKLKLDSDNKKLLRKLTKQENKGQNMMELRQFAE